MKAIVIIAVLYIGLADLTAQNTKDKEMTISYITTNIGEIAIYQKIVEGTIPVIFLHGVYYDSNLWNYYTSRITDRTVITVDMPHHGKSKSIEKKKWTMDDCANMLLEILDTLNYEKVYGIGHSWGSMTLLRAAVKSPEKFKSLGFCNMPVSKGTFGKKMQFGFVHTLLPFRSYYAKQVSKSMFSKENRKQKPELSEYLEISMFQLSKKEIRRTDKAVISKVNDGNQYVSKLQTPALALKGDEDYVKTLKTIETTVVSGKHTSPLEQPEEVMKFIRQVFQLK